MPSFHPQSGEPKPAEKEYTEIIQSKLAVDRKFLDGTGAPAKIVYFCPTCKKLITPRRIGQKFRFACTECKGDAAFGTEEAITNYYKLTGTDKTKTKINS